MRLLYSAGSPFARLVRIALREAGLDAAVIRQELTRERLYSPGSDVLAHFGGFFTGLLLGSLLTLWPRLARSTAVNLSAGALFCLLVTLTWWLAIAKG